MARRTEYIKQLASLLGPDLFKIVDLSDGWPSLCRIRVGEKWISAAVHVVRFSEKGYRGRDDVERRAQNPNQRKPLSAPPGYRPVVIGLEYQANEIVAVVGFDASRRMQRGTRQSLFVPLAPLRRAAIEGWVDHTRTNEETVHIFRPQLLPVFVGMNETQIQIPEMPEIVVASGFLEDPTAQAGERARRAALRAVRRHGFGQAVVKAYAGECAMCGLDHGLVEGAHIYPVQAPDSPDTLWNGIALCGNHHRAFDRHELHIHPEARTISVHPRLIESSGTSDALRSLLQSTADELRPPRMKAARPRPEMFERRYQFFSEAYSWAS